MYTYRKIDATLIYEKSNEGDNAFKQFEKLCSDQLLCSGVVSTIQTDRGMYENSVVLAKDNRIRLFIIYRDDYLGEGCHKELWDKCKEEIKNKLVQKGSMIKSFEFNPSLLNSGKIVDSDMKL